MQRILTASEMREVDRRTTEETGIPSLLLMENAAAQVVRGLEAEFGPLSDHRIVILCGKGANGGDGLAIARQLWVQGLARELQAALLADPAQLEGDAAVNWRMAEGLDVPVSIISDSADWQAFRDQVLRATLIVDALLGTGLQGPVRGLVGQAIDDLSRNFGHIPFVAVDLPSGMPSDGGDLVGAICPANLTVTFTAPKISQAFLPGCERIGKLRVAAIGSPESLINGLAGMPLFLLGAEDAAPLCGPRKTDAHKGSFGHVGVLGGSRSKPGAAILAGMTSARSGSGLTTVVTARSAAPLVVAALPELMTIPVSESQDGTMGADQFDLSALDAFSVLVIGPGFGVSEESSRLCLSILRHAEQPVVADADALTALSQTAEWECEAQTLVLTPHPGEMARLTGLSTAEVQQDRIDVSRRLAAERAAYVVLKGARTIIACPDGRTFINPTGGPGMATGGSGDVLAGLIGGLLAQYPEQDPALVVAGAVYLHGLSGDLAAASLGEQSMLATDILEFLPQAIRQVQPDRARRF